MIPTGVISLWSGAVGDIPAGWALCDGNNGTPNLRNRFIVGAGDSYAVDDTGGAVNHNHDGTTDGHGHDLDIGNHIADVAPGGNLDDTTTSDTDTFTTDTDDHLPPYYALAYIMRT